MFFRKDFEDNKEEVIEKIICERYNQYFRMAYSLVHNSSDAEDIVQEGAYKAIKNSSSLKDIQYAQTWIYRIMLNEVYRYTSGRKEVPVEETFSETASKEDKYENWDLKEAMNRLDDTERVIVQLKYFEDLRLQDIAQITSLPLNTVKTKLYRGLKKLRIELEE